MPCTRGCCPTQAIHYRAVALVNAATERARAQQEDRDLAAYQRLRQSGVQPPSLVGAEALERGAEVPQEIVQGRLIRNARLRREVQADIDSSPPPAVTPT